MPHIVDVDQSVRIEDPGDTFLAFSNGISWVIRVPFRVKQAGFQALRDQGKSRKKAKPLLFAACVFLLLEDHLDQMERIRIDNEYDGYEDDIRGTILRYIWKHYGRFSKHRIVIESIGKKSPAHKKALATKRGGAAKVDRSITTAEIRNLLG